MGLNGFGDGDYSKASTSITVTAHYAAKQNGDHENNGRRFLPYFHEGGPALIYRPCRKSKAFMIRLISYKEHEEWCSERRRHLQHERKLWGVRRTPHHIAFGSKGVHTIFTL